jgi:hypothetical protein
MNKRVYTGNGVIHWSITDMSVGKNRRGTCLPYQGESWAHMVKFLKQTGPDEFLTAYQVNHLGDTVHYHDIDFSEEDSGVAEKWFSK